MDDDALISRARLALAIVLVLGIFAQMAFLLNDFILPWGWRVKQVWDQPRVVRSADMSLGAQARRVINFVRSVTPEDATIILPPEGEPGRFSLARSMQYFFFPRTLIECGSPDTQVCSHALVSPDTYVIAATDFPSPSTTSEKSFLASRQPGWSGSRDCTVPGSFS